MKADLPQVQVVYLTTRYVPARNNKVVPMRGDFSPMLLTAPNAAAIPRVLANAYNANRHADIFVVNLPDDKEFQYPAKEFELRLSRFIGSSTKPDMTIPEFLKLFTSKL